MITEAEQRHLKQLPFGIRLLQVVQDRAWEKVPDDREACDYMKSRCIICSLHFSRCQELQQHYRLQHAELWEHAPQQAIQLTNVFSSDVPCNCCGSQFKIHSCPIWAQLAVLLVNGAGIDVLADLPQLEVRQRCDLCQEAFDSPATLVQHLQEVHSLQGISFQESRDSLDNTSACAHCGMLFLTKGGLKSHVVQGRCVHFNPQAVGETIPVDPLWREACIDGQFHAIMESPSNRMQLTVVCQACGKGCRRASDLSHHLQTSHARLWRQSQRLTMVMVDAFYHIRCYCNPSVGQKRGSHICLVFRQLAMAFLRLN